MREDTSQWIFFAVIIFIAFIAYNLVTCILQAFQGVTRHQSISTRNSNIQPDVVRTKVQLPPELAQLQALIFPKCLVNPSYVSSISIAIEKTSLAVGDGNENSNFNMQNFDATVAKLSKISSVYILVHATTDEEQDSYMERFFRILPSADSKQLRRILFYGSEIGKIAILRQLSPKLHIEHDSSTYKAISPHLEDTVLILKAVSSHNLTSNPSEKIISKYEDILQLDRRI